MNGAAPSSHSKPVTTKIENRVQTMQQQLKRIHGRDAA
jgi:hypothetical protein